MPDKKKNDPASGSDSALGESENIADFLARIPSSRSAAGGGMREQASSGKNQRKHHRHPVRWRVAVVNKSGGNNEIFHGRTYDVSVSGISVLLERNMFFTSDVVILLAIPPEHQGMRETIVEIQCSVTHTVLDSEHQQFRLGMKFVQFKRDGKKILTEVLSRRHIPKQESSRYT